MALLLRDKIDWAKGLAIACPFGQEQPDCPLREIRLKPVIERLKIIESMSDEELNLVIQHHRQCLEKLEGGME